MSTFTGFSEEDLKRIKSGDTIANKGTQNKLSNLKNASSLTKTQIINYKYRSPVLQQKSDDSIDDIEFEKCKLSIRTPTKTVPEVNNIEQSSDESNDNINSEEPKNNNNEPKNNNEDAVNVLAEIKLNEELSNGLSSESRKSSTDVTPDIVRCVDNYTEEDLAIHRAKLEELQLKQKIMEEQNKKRKEMLAKALADRTKQTTEEVLRLEKIKKELQVLDGQFSQDVSVLRKKIDQACLSYADAEKHYLKVEKEFLQAKIQLQKEKEKKELLTEHLCALITHNETRKAQKLETLMLELATDKKRELNFDNVNEVTEDDNPVIVGGVDEKTGKIVEFTPQT